MSEPTGPGWPQSPAAWRVAQACEGLMQRFERAMHDLVTTPGVSPEQAREAAAGLLQMAQDATPTTEDT